MFTLVNFTSEKYQVKYYDESISFTYYDKEEDFFNEYCVFVKKNKKIFTLDGDEITKHFSSMNSIGKTFLENKIINIPGRFFFKYKFIQKIDLNVDISKSKDHPITFASQNNKFSSISLFNDLKKLIEKSTSLKYEKCKSIEVYNKFNFLEDIETYLVIGNQGFDHEWLINETNFLLDLYQKMKNNGEPVYFKGVQNWIRSVKINSVLHLFLSYSLESFQTFIESINFLNLDLSNDNINSLGYIIEVYSLCDDDICKLISILIKFNLQYDVIYTSNLFSSNRLNMILNGQTIIKGIESNFDNLRFEHIILNLYVIFVEQLRDTDIVINSTFDSFTRHFLDDKTSPRLNSTSNLIAIKHINKFKVKESMFYPCKTTFSNDFSRYDNDDSKHDKLIHSFAKYYKPIENNKSKDYFNDFIPTALKILIRLKVINYFSFSVDECLNFYNKLKTLLCFYEIRLGNESVCTKNTKIKSSAQDVLYTNELCSEIFSYLSIKSKPFTLE